jgi:hypothetical protein
MLKLMEKNEIEKQRIGHCDLKDILSKRLIKESSIGNKQFNNMDGKVLRFCAILDDQDQQCEILRKFIIHVISLIFEELFRKVNYYF